MEKNPFLKASPQYEKIKKEVYGRVYNLLPNNDIVMSSSLVHYIEDHPNIEIDDRRTETGEVICLPWNNTPFKPRNYQEDALNIMSNNYRGLINLATGLGKTLLAIHFIKRYKRKTLIIVPSDSIAKQFVSEAKEAFGDKKVEMYGGGRKKTADITVAIAASVIKNLDVFSKLDLGLVMFDECFPYRTNISTSDGPMEIGKLVKLWEKGEKLPLIESYNQTSNKFEYKRMTYGWRKQREDLVEIKLSKRKIKCTPEHKILTLDGWKSARSLSTNDIVIGSTNNKLEKQICPALNSDQIQVLIGSFLGDGHIQKASNNRYRLSEIHCKKQEDYIKWKASMFNISDNIKYIKENGYSKKEALKFTSKCFDIKDYIPKTKTMCPNWMIDTLDERGLAIWFMDDGYGFKTKNGGSIAVCSFDNETQDKLVLKLRSFGIDAKRYFVKCKDHRAPGYWIIQFTKNGYERLSKIISPYIHDTMRYKIINNESYKYNWNSSFLNHGTVPVSCVKSIKNRVLKNRKPYVFDIEVEDNHNFIVCSSTDKSGIIAHNCHHIAANTFFEISKNLSNIGKMFGLTATDYRSDGKDILIEAGCGRTLIKRDLIWGVKNGWLAKPVFKIREVDTVGKDYKDKLKSYKEHVLNSSIMKNTISNDIRWAMENKKSFLCLVAEISHGEELSKEFGVPFAKGTDKMSQSYVNQLNKGKIPGLIGTTGKVGEGTDTKNVEVLILANFMASKGIVVQSIGRGLRKTNTKDTCTIIDYRPTGSDMLSRHSKTREELYKTISKDIEVHKYSISMLKLVPDK